MDTGVIVKMISKSICVVDELRLNMFWQQFVNQKRNFCTILWNSLEWFAFGLFGYLQIDPSEKCTLENYKKSICRAIGICIKYGETAINCLNNLCSNVFQLELFFQNILAKLEKDLN